MMRFVDGMVVVFVGRVDTDLPTTPGKKRRYISMITRINVAPTFPVIHKAFTQMYGGP